LYGVLLFSILLHTIPTYCTNGTPNRFSEVNFRWNFNSPSVPLFL
jgi:hypothetical protein